MGGEIGLKGWGRWEGDRRRGREICNDGCVKAAMGKGWDKVRDQVFC